MSEASVQISPANPSIGSGSSAVAAQDGSLSITTNPSPLAFVILDQHMNNAAQGVSPMRVQLTPGLYLVRATMANNRDLSQFAQVVSSSDRSVHLSYSDPNLARVAASLFSGLMDKYVRNLEPLPPQSGPSLADVSGVKPEPFWIRYVRMKDWDTAEAVALPAFSSSYIRGRAILEITNPEQNVLFAQVAVEGGPVLNVAIPPAGALHPTRCQLVVTPVPDLFQAYVRLSTDWANAAMQYMAKGYLDQAKQLVVTGTTARQPSGFISRVFEKIVSRFDDPAAAFVPRYIELRTREATALSTLGESLLDLAQRHLSDGAVISAEVRARAGEFQFAAQLIAGIPQGSMPLFTEGFSLLIHRVRELLDLDAESVAAEQRPFASDVAKLKMLKRKLGKWAPYIDLNCPTVTFFGKDVMSPTSEESSVTPSESAGWIRGPAS